MPYDSNGNYSLPAVYNAEAGTTIQPAQHNTPLEDVQSALNSVMLRSGVAPMTASLKIPDGSEGAPAIVLNSQAGWGLYKTATGIGISISGTKAFEAAPGGVVLSTINIIGGTAAAVAVDDTLPFYDLSDTANRRVAIAEFLKVIGLLPVDSAPVASTDFVMTYDADFGGVKRVLLGNLPARSPRGYIDGCTLSNNTTDATNDIDIAAGVCRDSTNAVDINVAAMAGKRLDGNWAPGASLGMRNSAVGIADGTYHIYAVAKLDGTQDIYAHTSATVSTVLAALQVEPNGSTYVYARRIGSIIRATSILPFTQVGDEFTLTTMASNTAVTNPGNTAVLRTLTVPLGIRVNARFKGGVADPSNINVVFSFTSTDQSDEAPHINGAPASHFAQAGSVGWVYDFSVRTNTSGQVRSRLSNSSASAQLYISVYGWIDPRGRV